MNKQRNFFTPLHKHTTRDYLGRMMDDKVHCMQVARQYDREYWDGDRRYGYGGYRYDGRWKPVAQRIVRTYRLPPHAAILDVGCGKAHLLFELKKLLPGATIAGFDISQYGIDHAQEEVKPFLFLHQAQQLYPYKDKSFDLVISINTLHNLHIQELKKAVQEIERVGKQKYICVEGYRNEQELFNLQCWALTANAFFTPEEWKWLYRQFGYSGDYEFIFFE